jgi:hemerythrin
MDLLEWKSSYALGVSSVDHEHQEMIKAINGVYASFDDQAAVEKIESALGEIHANISAHFALEEQLMSDAGYEEYAEHKNDHEELLDQIRDMMDVYVVDPAKGKSVLQACLTDWFGQHFATFDARAHHRLG